MNKLMVGLIAFLMVSAPSALGAEAPVPAQDHFPQNKLVNPGFENGSYGWTASGGATKTANATAKGEGSFGYDWDSNSASQTLVSTAYTVESSLFGKNGLAYCAIKTPSGTSTHTMSVNDGSADLVTAVTITTSSSQFVRVPINFPFPSSGSVKIKFTSVASNEPEIYIDSCYLGEAYNISQVNQASLVASGYIPTTGSCTWTRTSATLGEVATTAACPGPTVETNNGPGTLQTTDADLPRFTVNNLPPGTYRASFDTTGFIATSAQEGSVAINDGTTTFGQTGHEWATSGSHVHVEGVVTYTTTANVTFKLYLSSTANQVTIANNGTGEQTYFTLTRFPSAGELAYRPDLGPASWSGYHDNTCAFTRTSATYGDPTADTTCALVERTNRNFGTVTSYLSGSDKLPGIVATLPRAGKYRVEACFSGFGPTTNTVVLNYELSEVAGTVLSEGYLQTTNTSATAMAICVKGDYIATGAVSKTFRLRMKSDSGVNTISAPASATSAIEWTIVSLDATLAAPVLIGSVTSASTGSEHIERATINISGASTASIVSQSGSWISSVSAATSVATVNITSGEWSSAPSCTCTPHGLITDGEFCRMNSSPTTSVLTFYVEVATTPKLDKLDIICMGPR